MGGSAVTPRLNSLRKRVLLPFFLILLVAGTIITCGTSVDFTTSYSRSVDDRLQAFQDAIYREVKKEEHLLVTYATLLEYMHPVDAGTAGVLQDQFYHTLHEANIAVARYPAAAREILPYPALRDLLDQAQKSGRPRFRLVTDIGSIPTLIVASPTSLNSEMEDVVVLRTPFDRGFLRRIAAGFKVVPHLLSMDGSLLVAGEDNAKTPALSQPELAIVLAGKPVFKTGASRRYLFQGIPLGTTDLVIAVAEAPLYDLGSALQLLTLRSVLIFAVALIIGSFFYYRLAQQIARPIDEIVQGAREVGNGNLSFRLGSLADNEIGQIGPAFNSMLESLARRHEEDIAREKSLGLAEAQERQRELLERKNGEIASISQELKTQQREISLLLRMIQATNSLHQDVNLYLERMTELLQKTVPCQSLALLLHHPGAEEFEVRKATGPDPDFLLGLKFRVDSGFIGRAVKLQEMIYLNDLKTDHPRFYYRAGSFPGGSLVCSPMVTSGRLMGLMLMQKEESHAFSETELKLIQAVSCQMAIGLETARLYEWTHTQSTVDDLTGLSNRRFFQEILKRELAQAQRYGSQFSLLMLDLDRFKGYNETQGNLCGDSAMKQVANILLQNTRGIDLVARFGTDRFSILLPKTDKTGGFRAAEKLRQCIAEYEFPGADGSLPPGELTVSIGISSYPADSRDFYELIDCADRALRRAKETGRNCCQFWQPPQKAEEKTSRYPAIS